MENLPRYQLSFCYFVVIFPFDEVGLLPTSFKSKFISVQSSQVTDTSANKSEEKVTEARYSTHSLEEVAGMIRKTISVYEAKVFFR